MADEVMFGTPETWGMKVGQFIEEKENILPQPKPQDVIEQRRKDSLRKFLFDYPGAVEQETVDYIQERADELFRECRKIIRTKEKRLWCYREYDKS